MCFIQERYNSNNEVKKIQTAMTKLFKKSALYKKLEIKDVSIICHDIKQKGFTLVNTNSEYTSRVAEISKEFSRNGARTIRATKGYTVPLTNPNRAEHAKYQESSLYVWIRTEALILDAAFFETVISTKKEIKTEEHKNMAKALHYRLKDLYFQFSRKIKLYDLQDLEIYSLKREQSIKEKQEKLKMFSASSNFLIKGLRISSNKTLKANQVRVIMGLLSNYSNDEFQDNFGVSKSVKNDNIRKIKNILELNEKATNADMLHRLQFLGVIDQINTLIS